MSNIENKKQAVTNSKNHSKKLNLNKKNKLTWKEVYQKCNHSRFSQVTNVLKTAEIKSNFRNLLKNYGKIILIVLLVILIFLIATFWTNLNILLCALLLLFALCIFAIVYGTYFDLSPNYRGSVGTDYFLLIEIYTEILNEGQEDEETVEHRRYYYYTVSQSGDRSYSEPVQITAEIPLAQEDIIGGFYNVPETQLDAGYVFRDETGHLVLLDYALLRSGVLAYQLGEDFESPANITFEEVQTNLDEYVNERVAFPNANQQQNADNPNVINITLNLSEEAEEDSPIINIYNIDSRFNTSIYIHINGSANSATVINISDCQKVRIDSNINGNSGTRPTINLYRSCLYYDPNVIDIVLPDDLDYWNYTAPNDNHYMYALQSITFGPDGSIVGAGMYVKNETTSNVATGKSIITSTFSLPQGYGLNYPKSKLTKQIKITGSFVSAYANTSPEGYMVMNTSFSALTNATDPNNSDTNVAEGSISFLTDAELIQSVAGLPLGTTLDCWQTGSFNVFHGVVI